MEPLKKEDPWSPPPVVYLWLLAFAAVMVGGWALIMWGLGGWA